METALLWLGGVVAFVLALAVSIAFHELGHLTFAKLFGVKVTQYMIGFGRTLWSRKRGETEYGVKAIPLGGYISMIGMYPPGPDGTPRPRGRIGQLIDEARQSSVEAVQPGEEGRTFYALAPWKRIIVMLAGPAANLVLAIVLLIVIAVGIGIPTVSTSVASVSECLKPVTDASAGCSSSDPLAPAAAAGLEPGDRIVAIDGTRIANWDQLSSIVEAAPGKPLTFRVERGGSEVSLTVTPKLSSKQVAGADGKTRTIEAGVVGITPGTEYVHQGLGGTFTLLGQGLQQVTGMVLGLPERMVQVWNAAFGSQARDPNGPVGIVGVGRFAGDIAADTQYPVIARVQSMLSVFASLNLSLFVFNLVPLLPLDGGHVLGALWEQVKRWWFAVFRRGRKAKPVDMARVIPLTMAVAAVLIVMEALLLYADLVKPISG